MIAAIAVGGAIAVYSERSSIDCGLGHVGHLDWVWVLAASLSPTPAGIGAVEIAMVAAMAGAGARGSYAITAVLVYRAISLKGGGARNLLARHTGDNLLAGEAWQADDLPVDQRAGLAETIHQRMRAARA
jgi:hypothetical protein